MNTNCSIPTTGLSDSPRPGRRESRAPIHTRLGFALTLAVLALGAGRAAAVEATGDFRFWSDYAVFRLDPDTSAGYVEFYYEMKRIDFAFRPVDDRLRADVYTWVHVRDEAGNAIDSMGGAFVSVVADSTELADSNFTMFFARALILRPGRYHARAVVIDLSNKKSAEAFYPITVRDFSADGLVLSDIEFAYDILDRSGDTMAIRNDVLVKSGQKVFPDCRGLVNNARPRLMFYSELYNLGFDPTQDNSYQMELSIVPHDSVPARSFGPQVLTKPGVDAVLATGVSVRDLAPGTYDLKIDVTDPARGQTATVSKPFVVLAAPVDSLTEEEEARIRDIIFFIARPEEMATFDRLNAVGKRTFWHQFWAERDPSPGTPENEAKTEHLRRMNFANEKFSIGTRERGTGWQTDMGRVYIVYGEPNLIERYPFTPERPPAQIWYYDHLIGQGQVLFLFIDESGYGEYNLVHSSARGERRDPSWERQIQQGAFERTQ